MNVAILRFFTNLGVGKKRVYLLEKKTCIFFGGKTCIVYSRSLSLENSSSSENFRIYVFFYLKTENQLRVRMRILKPAEIQEQTLN